VSSLPELQTLLRDSRIIQEEKVIEVRTEHAEVAAIVGPSPNPALRLDARCGVRLSGTMPGLWLHEFVDVFVADPMTSDDVPQTIEAAFVRGLTLLRPDSGLVAWQGTGAPSVPLEHSVGLDGTPRVGWATFLSDREFASQADFGPSIEHVSVERMADGLLVRITDRPWHADNLAQLRTLTKIETMLDAAGYLRPPNSVLRQFEPPTGTDE
jgi:hypothetical protein